MCVCVTIYRIRVLTNKLAIRIEQDKWPCADSNYSSGQKREGNVLTDLGSVAVMSASTLEKSPFLTSANAENSAGATSGSFLCRVKKSLMDGAALLTAYLTACRSFSFCAASAFALALDFGCAGLGLATALALAFPLAAVRAGDGFCSAAIASQLSQSLQT